MCREYTYPWIARKIEFYNSYFAKISNKKVISENSGFRLDNPIRTVFVLRFLSF